MKRMVNHMLIKYAIIIIFSFFFIFVNKVNASSFTFEESINILEIPPLNVKRRKN